MRSELVGFFGRIYLYGRAVADEITRYEETALIRRILSNRLFVFS